MIFCGLACVILGRTTEASEDVCDEAEAMCSVRMVLLWAMHALVRVSPPVSCFVRRVWETYYSSGPADDEDAIARRA